MGVLTEADAAAKLLAQTNELKLAQHSPGHQKKPLGWRQALGGKGWWHLLVETEKKRQGEAVSLL